MRWVWRVDGSGGSKAAAGAVSEGAPGATARLACAGPSPDGLTLSDSNPPRPELVEFEDGPPLVLPDAGHGRRELSSVQSEDERGVVVVVVVVLGAVAGEAGLAFVPSPDGAPMLLMAFRPCCRRPVTDEEVDESESDERMPGMSPKSGSKKLEFGFPHDVRLASSLELRPVG